MIAAGALRHSGEYCGDTSSTQYCQHESVLHRSCSPAALQEGFFTWGSPSRSFVVPGAELPVQPRVSSTGCTGHLGSSSIAHTASKAPLEGNTSPSPRRARERYLHRAFFQKGLFSDGEKASASFSTPPGRHVTSPIVSHRSIQSLDLKRIDASHCRASPRQRSHWKRKPFSAASTLRVAKIDKKNCPP